MAIGQKDIKLLWGRSGNRCAICRVELSQDAKYSNLSFPLGEQAHIVGEKDDAARGKSILTEAERNSYHNLILLCPNHHTEIDKNEADWPVEKIHMQKSEHELWVQQTLSNTVDSKKTANQAIVASIVDSAVKNCMLEDWQIWTSHAFPPEPEWPRELPNMIFAFRKKMISAIWPEEFSELKRAMITFSILLHRAAQKFLEHSKKQGDLIYTDKFYKGNGNYNPRYDADLELYNQWLDSCDELLKDATKAANWMADIVRRDINPMFFATEGKFLIIEGPFMDLSFRTRLLEFSEEEKQGFPESLLK